MNRPETGKAAPTAAAYDVVTCQNVVVSIHRHGAAEPALEAQLGALSRVVGATADGVGFLLILVDGAKTPEPSGRRRVTDTFAAMGSKLRGVAIVMGGSGFWSSAVRSTVAVLLISIARGYSAKIFGSTNDAADWLAGQVRDCKAPATASELRRIANELTSA
jgi:hypothetical protein